jgi:hypothetical protein
VIPKHRERPLRTIRDMLSCVLRAGRRGLEAGLEEPGLPALSGLRRPLGGEQLRLLEHRLRRLLLLVGRIAVLA